MQIEIRADNTVHISGYVNAVERESRPITQQFGLGSSVRVNMMSMVHATTTAVNLTRSVARTAGK